MNNQNKITRKYKLKDKSFPTPNQLEKLSFGQQIEYLTKISNFKDECRKLNKVSHVLAKRTTHAHALNQFIELNNVQEYYCHYYDTNQIRDDSFTIWYKN